MVITLGKGIDIFDIIEKFKLTNFKSLLIKFFKEVSKSLSFYYIGEYNKTDIIF